MNYDFTDGLKKDLLKLKKKDLETYRAIKKKIKEIVNSGNIEHYKNLRAPSQHLKGVHIRKSFVLVFEYYKKKNKIMFVDFDHHDKIY